jgi:hypothetical protein
MASKEEWFQILDQEEGHKFILLVLDEVLQKSQTVIFQKRIEAQLIPYTANHVKQSVLNTVQV